MAPVYREDINVSDNQNNMDDKLKNDKKKLSFLFVYEKKVVTLHYENKANHNKDYSVVKTFRVGS